MRHTRVVASQTSCLCGRGCMTLRVSLYGRDALSPANSTGLAVGDHSDRMAQASPAGGGP